MKFSLKALLMTGTALAAAFPSTAMANEAGDDVETILVVAARESRTSKGATNLPLDLMETPQSVTVIGRDFMERFGLKDVNKLLNLTTGVNVEEVETDRTYYNARGFDIKSMQVDGIGLPFNWNVVGALDTVIYERVEVIRGANGLLTGTGNPSGTINYVRKRPTNDFQAYGEASFGSWDRKRLEVDVSGPLTESGSWAGRFVGAVESGDSYLNLYENDRTVFYGVIDGQLGDNATVTFGFTQQDNKSDGVLWGALPMLDASGKQTEFDVSSSTSMNWTFWNTKSKTAFAELTYLLPAGWEAKAVVTWNQYDEPSELFYTYSSPAYDSETGLGLYGYPGKYFAGSERWLLDATLTGDLQIGGRAHEMVFGINAAHSDSIYDQEDAPFTDPAWGALPSFPGWSGNEIGRPDFANETRQGDWTDKVARFYGAGNFHLSDSLSLIAGFNAIHVKTEGVSFDEPMDREEDKISPYVGVTWSVLENVNLYASYSDIYEAQSETDAFLKPLGAAVGKSYEAGVKAEWFDKRLYTSFAIFKADQDNFAEWVGYNDDGIGYYKGIDIRSKGFEIEAAGRISEDWTIQAGYTDFSLKDPDGNQSRTFIPRKTFNLGTSLEVPMIEGLSLGGTLKWQEAMHLEAAGGTIRQKAFTLISLTAAYDVTENVEIGFNVDNLTDEKYLTSLYWDQAFYGAPRNVMARLKVRY
ncbi:TonB-dependent siderophore receptor [Gimibacter soli]|uniref:TonB-dependent siderophore receptor n=1 Tax=Gimibacter soli TaxID=3024400 RepID=A0AAF0BKC5_9PROT|nr:TonB-dependent siderophore receptor [Gimibacter soli]WCL54119.1 TonB-dependent siderophore receptor [Gimibacter soli]